MGGERSDSVLRPVHTLFNAGALGALEDGELLSRFAQGRDEAAFAALVTRHGPMVLGLCRRLAGAADADDAFQATFLVLARKAGGLRDPNLLAPWLHGVARRTAEKARLRAARRRDRERLGGLMRIAEGATDPDPTEQQELAALLHDELGRLPSSFRAALILCHLEGLSHDEAARRLRVPVGTVRSRLSRGRDRVLTRLALRGLTAPALLLVTAATASASVPPPLIDRTALAAARVAAGQSAAGAATAGALELSRAVARSLLMNQLKGITSALLALIALAGAGGLAAARYFDGPPAPLAVRQDERGPVEDPLMAVTTSGRVLDPEGKPVAGAKVAIIADARAAGRDASDEDRRMILGGATTDKTGRYQLRMPTVSSSRFLWVRALAAAEGFGVGWAELNADAASPESEIRLRPEEILRGRAVDAQGRPAAGVLITVHGFSVPSALIRADRAGIYFDDPPRDHFPWPKPTSTDAEGRFKLRGMAPGLTVGLIAQGDCTISHAPNSTCSR